MSEASRDSAAHYLWRHRRLQPLDTDRIADGPESVILTLFSKPTAPPPWETLVVALFSPEGFVPVLSRSQGAVIYVPVTDPSLPGSPLRWVCWAFGSASRILRRTSLEPRFGLIAALNRIARADEGGLRQLEYRSFGAYRQRTGHTAGRDTPLDGFRIDPLVDLLSGAGGRTGEGANAQVHGARPIRLHAEVNGVADLQALAQAAMDDSRDSSYQQVGFSFVDDFIPVEDEGQWAALRARLAELILAGSDRIDAFFPDDLVDYEDPRAIHFVLLPNERASNPSRVTLTPSNLASALGEAGEQGLDRTVRFLDSSGEEMARATVLDCVAADFLVEDERYVVSDGDFYRVRQGFVDAIDESLASLPSSPVTFLPYMGGEESIWLRHVSDTLNEEFVCTDGELIRPRGESPFEAADLVHVSGTLVHAKRKGRSSVLSYAMTQARRSCQLLLMLVEARTQLDDVVRSKAASDSVADQVVSSLAALERTPPKIDVILAILGPTPRRGLAGFPLLAKIELVETARQIGQLGFGFSVALVGA